MKNHFLAQKYRDQYFLFDYYNLCLIQTDKELYNCAVDYLSGGQSISSIEEIRNTSFSPYAEDLIYLLEQNILISNSVLNCDIMFFKKPEMLKNKHFRLFLFLVCF